MRHALMLATLLLTLPAAAQHGSHSPYAAEAERGIKALSDRDTADLLAGRGMGLARAAELNSHPGPMHVLELDAQLGLSGAQRGAVQASQARMQAAAQALGAELVGRERALDALFRTGAATPERVSAEAEAIGALQGRVRAVHLNAHVEMRALLSPAQVAQYDAARGYAAARPPG